MNKLVMINMGSSFFVFVEGTLFLRFKGKPTGKATTKFLLLFRVRFSGSVWEPEGTLGAGSAYFDTHPNGFAGQPIWLFRLSAREDLLEFFLKKTVSFYGYLG